MKTNLCEINLHGYPENGAGWWTWDETCDICGEKIHTYDKFISSEKPDMAEKSLCINCTRKILDNKNE